MNNANAMWGPERDPQYYEAPPEFCILNSIINSGYTDFEDERQFIKVRSSSKSWLSEATVEDGSDLEIKVLVSNDAASYLNSSEYDEKGLAKDCILSITIKSNPDGKSSEITATVKSSTTNPAEVWAKALIKHEYPVRLTYVPDTFRGSQSEAVDNQAASDIFSSDGYQISLSAPGVIPGEKHCILSFNMHAEAGEILNLKIGRYEGRLADGKANGRGVLYYNSGAVYTGEWKDGGKNGHGEIVGTDGKKYNGEWKDGKKAGYGVFSWPDGDTYEGEWKDDLRNGHGVYRFSDGRVYDGEWQNDLKAGHGSFTWPSGNTYEGEWKDGLRNGHGIYRFSDGRVYDGEWKEDQKAGHGIFTWPSGHKYEGEWLENVRSGHGLMVWSNGRKYDGDWSDDKIDGQGVFTWPSGGVYEGEWKKGQRVGTGILKSGQKVIYQGLWENDYPKVDKTSFQGINKAGEFFWPNGNRYIGSVVAFRPDGNGMMFYPNGDKYDGDFKDGIRSGRGKYTYKDGRVIDGEWADDKIVKTLQPSAPAPTSVPAPAPVSAQAPKPAPKSRNFLINLKNTSYGSIRYLCKQGQTVKRGDHLVEVNVMADGAQIILAPFDGTIKELLKADGFADRGDLLLSILSYGDVSEPIQGLMIDEYGRQLAYKL